MSLKARRLVNECVMIEFGAAAVTRDLPSGTACQEFLPRMASFLWAVDGWVPRVVPTV